MSYYLEVIKDTPHSLYMLDGTTAHDASGHGYVPAVVGTFTASAPLVNGVTRAAKIDAGAYSAYPFPYMSPGTERQAVTIESWFMPTTVSSLIATRLTTSTGLYWSGAALYFILQLSTDLVACVYTPIIKEKIHAVGVYTGTSLQLYVNGELVDSQLLTTAQLAQSIAPGGDDTRMYSGNSSTIQQATAFYLGALPEERIKAHYEAGNNTSGSTAAASIYNGVYAEMNRKTANIFYQKNWNDWTKGQYTAAVNDTGVFSAVDPTTGLYIASTWQDSFELDAGGISIESVQIECDGEGSFTVETSINNGSTWSPLDNTRRVAGITSGFNPTGITVIVRVTFANGVYGHFNFLRLTGFRNLSIASQATLPIVLPAGTNIMPDREINVMNLNTGIEIPTGSVTIGPSTEEGAVGYKSINFWYSTPTGPLTTNFTGQFYENGVAMTSRTVTQRWTMVTITSPTAFTSAITLGGTGIRLSHVSLYEDELSVSQIADIRSAYTGQITRVSSSTDSLGAFTDQDATVYASDWSISPVG